MKKLLLSTLFLLASVSLFAQEIKPVSGLYCGGHIRRGRPGTYTKVRESGFTYVILFNVNVEEDGTLTTDGQTICKDGKYVFDETNRDYADDVASLKSDESGVQRIEICIGGWGNKSYGNIKKLIGSASSITSTSILYKNFKALKEAVPEIEAVNNDQEQDYDVSSAVKFHVMMNKLGYKTSIAPYTYLSYWKDFVTQLNNQRKGACDCVMVQCYDGGANNNPKDWHINGITLHAGLLDYSNDWSVERNLTQFEKWRDDCNVAGGFVWLFNDGYDENWDLQGWATGMNRMYNSIPVAAKDTAVVVYSNTKYNGYGVALPVGRYGKGKLAACGIKANDLESVKVKDGYVVRFFKTNMCTGSSLQKKTDATSLSTYSNAVNSVIVMTQEMADNGDSLKAACTALNTDWKTLNASIKADYADMLNDAAFLEAYNLLNTEIPALYKDVNAMDYYERGIRYTELMAKVEEYRSKMEALMDNVTSIALVNDASGKNGNAVYTLDGKKVNGANARGLFILGGKKVAQ